MSKYNTDRAIVVAPIQPQIQPETDALIPKPVEKQCILINPNPNDNIPELDGLFPKPVVDGGVAVAVIFAISYFSTRLLRSVVEVMKVNKKGK